jgi:nicotinate-nucleotide adenylyltransferase
MQGIGIFCGTFNPIHLGHLLVAECARDQFELEKILFITSPRPPHRSDVLLEARERHNMVACAVAGNPNFEASMLEIERPGPSYTIDTIRQVIERFGNDCQMNLLLGADNLKQLSTWHRVDEICRFVRFLVAPRFADVNERSQSTLHSGNGNIPAQAKYELIDFPAVDISSSEIRKRIAEGRTVLYMVPPAVNQLLSTKGYYRGSRV